jgi:diaminohydroxyphosphoribosylaminopyrimidine deaminase/5-amino-6-(5-phosphoribosylamino)uracil reductase
MSGLSYMMQALELAFGAMGSTSPNPAVGAIIVKNGVVMGRGSTGPCGGPHAEIRAIQDAGGSLEGAEMYVSLEPCCHYGKTPPCTDAIIRSGIRKVYLPILDPNPLVAGKGVLALGQSGVDVEIVRDAAQLAADLLRPFRKYIMRKKPFVVHKVAMTLDGHIATQSGDSRWISSDSSRCLAHRARLLADAVVIGGNTMRTDNPALTVRLSDFDEGVKASLAETAGNIEGYDNFFLKMLLRFPEGAQRDAPERVVVGLPDDLELHRRFFADDQYLFFVAEEKRKELARRADGARIAEEIEKGKIVFVPGHDRLARVGAVMDELYRRGMMLVLLEGGSALAGSFFDAGEIDHYLYFIAPRVFGRGMPPIAGDGVEAVRESAPVCDVSTVRIAGDVLYSGYAMPYNFEMM